MDHYSVKQDQKRNGSFHFFYFLVLEGNKSLSYYSVSTESVNTLDLSKTSLKVETIIFGQSTNIKIQRKH